MVRSQEALSYSGLVQNSNNIADYNLKSDDFWIIDNKHSSILPSYRGQYSFRICHCQSPLQQSISYNDYGYISDESMPNPDVVDDNYHIVMVSDMLTTLQGTFTNPSCFHLLELKCLLDFQYDIFFLIMVFCTLRNPIQPLHAPAFSAGMSHQCFQVSFRPQSSRIMPANDDWPPTTPWCWRPSVSPLPSPTSISSLPVPSPGGTGSQPYPGPVQDSSDIVDDDLESDDSWMTDDEDPLTLPSCGGRHSFGAHHCRSPLWQSGYSNDYGYMSDESVPNPNVVDDNYHMGMVSDMLTVGFPD